eukprot:CAMPEP_0113677174 /NCGR_PEP_ID=MMETSP0038_2-20120614/9098_1 /TAXON_ID=2898 /ORGANISM="Cryptomonas paramecium" /LENGTH=65 /DNA_ID=CAMNT_0000594377 /DNA_START=1014 /DNA_END=1211 /DNA_ORIENTATION=+ /assembly_acc=CAM_ASM_000170
MPAKPSKSSQLAEKSSDDAGQAKRVRLTTEMKARIIEYYESDPRITRMDSLIWAKDKFKLDAVPN